ncbi:GH36-type glycosyl hydrolase domain-containing protein [Fodinibius sp.]|uniref:GH36-type glycosyl hydrolase domain-containing protein n=1 Tax=Fodinibius sp. TaxID=1872440 RepID=UPI002ACD51E8|nr:glucoamylase family protein [Fodinibius sp.]MDZ7660138.1 glucoamylase family protein [Fodinibius sp.]
MASETQVHFNKQYLEEEIRQLAKLQEFTLDSMPMESIDKTLASAKKTLTKTYTVLARAAKLNRELSSAGEWLIDNFYIIQEQIVQLQADLPKSYYEKLPRLTQGEFKGYPRTYEIIQLLASISDNIIDQENTTIAIRAYQEVDILNLAEMWSVPLMNRLALIVRLAQRSEKLLRDRKIQDEIDALLNDKISGNIDEPGFLLRKLSEIVEQKDDSIRYLVILAQRLQSRGMFTESERRWFDYKLSRWETNLEEQLRARIQQTSRLHLSIQNAISSLREVSETDWSLFVESCSVVERILRLDPANMYPRMDFSTRDRYRKIIEKLSAHSTYNEQEVAEQALMMAESAAQNGTIQRSKKMHIGYYLIDDGYAALCQKLAYQKPLDERLRQLANEYPAIYFSFIGIHFVILIAIVGLVTNLLVRESWMIILTLIISWLPALDLSIVSTNRLLSFLIPPRILPKLKFDGAIPDEYRTVVIVPTMLSSPSDVEAQFELLEIRALANSNESLQFAIVSDFLDAETETRESDDAIMEAARQQINRLNVQYHSKYGDKFLFFHRKRLWNNAEQKWMGWERKRGKIEEFNQLLKNKDAQTSFIEIPEDFLVSVQKFPIKFVITLDADTKLPPGSAQMLIGAAAHPLNRAEIDSEKNIVTKGYGIFQPRISIPPKSANKTMFAKIYSGNVGLDPYTTAVSDIYQDLFGEAVFTGKGLYDLDAFDSVVGNRFPENQILSHDLLESTYLRAALLTDIELFDDYPTTYVSFSKRLHRWIRGDWQILSWLFNRVPKGGTEKERNPINSISRWKIFDNLRRSINPAALLLFLLAGWIFLPGSALIWTAAVFGIMAFPIYSSFSTDIFRRPQRVGWRLYLDKIRVDIKMNTIQAVTSFLNLPHQAFISLDAIYRTLYRLFVSEKHLLEWTTATQVEKQHSDGSMWDYWQKMMSNVIWSGLCLTLVSVFSTSVLFIAVPICLGWLLAPYGMYLLGRPLKTEKRELSQKQYLELRQYARRTWHFFEQYVNEEHSWLPPDNVQEEPYIGAVGRTSPTNMGLALTAVYSAFEMGYLTLSELVTQLDNMLSSMSKLERYRGHFYNWYSTKLGAVLNPNYVSTVDSGNLAASLLVIEQALYQLDKQPCPNPAFWTGLQDTIRVLDDLFGEYKKSADYKSLVDEVITITKQMSGKIPQVPPEPLKKWKEILLELREDAQKLDKLSAGVLEYSLEDQQSHELSDWLQRPLIQIQGQLDEIEELKGNNSKPSENRETFNNTAYADLLIKAAQLSSSCRQMVQEMDFSLVYDSDRELFSIGYNVDRANQDNSHYDLLASEARLASFIAIAKGEVPPEHWFRLSRRLTSIERNEILLSWGGTMFEYLMPLLFMSKFENTLLSNTYENVVLWQRNYGLLRNKPWGFSESGYNVRNLELHYQYRGFGVPGLGLRRGLAEDYVVAPYAGMLALMVDSRHALSNLQKLRDEGAYGASGFYEAVDYTPRHLAENNGINSAVVKMYMAHHQGMSLLALLNVLDNNRIQQLFHDHPLVRSCELLLQERIPRGIPIKEPRPIDVELEPAEEERAQNVVDHAGMEDLDDTPPRTHILSNGHYSTLISHSGTGYSYSDDLMLTRWRSDTVTDHYGIFFYIRDLESGNYWSAGHQPVKRKADRYDTWYHAGKVQIARVDDWIETFMEICVSPEDNIELRKITLTNYSERQRKIEITSYAEVVLNTQQADRAHPAFSNLFVQTEYLQEHHSILAKRRPRAEDEDPIWLVHTIASDDADSYADELQIETDREHFIGRNRSMQAPRAMDNGARLSGRVGNVKDPIVSIRRVITLKPGENKNITFGLGRVANRDEAVSMSDRYDNLYATDRVFELASIYGNVELEHVGLSGEQAQYIQHLTSYLVYNCEALRADENTLIQNRKTQSGLWAHGISGDVPILVYHIDDKKYMREVTLLLKAHHFWRQRGLKVDLVFMNDHPPSYINELQELIQQQLQQTTDHHTQRDKGGVFILRSDELSREDNILINTVAHVVLTGKLPNLAQLKEQEQVEIPDNQGSTYNPVEYLHAKNQAENIGDNLRFYNGYGGFSANGHEYVITLRTDPDTQKLLFPPAPWINVIANPNFGFLTTEKGSSYSWSKNSRENKLTPWSNDTVLDPSGEAIYIRDEDEKLFWSPMPQPVPGSAEYEIRHGHGYSTYRSTTMNIGQEVIAWVDKDDPIKFVKLRLSNEGLMDKKLTLFGYTDWVLGVFRENSARQIVTSVDENIQAIFARNHYNNEFAGRVAFSGFVTEKDLNSVFYSSDRQSFIGRNRNLQSPKAVKDGAALNGRFGMRFESCAAHQFSLELKSGESAEIYFYLGEVQDQKEGRTLISKYQNPEAIQQSLGDVKAFWRKKLGGIRVKTPEPELNFLMNGWLQYQNIACRMWGRTGFYQAGGAFGFRDQLQDATAACYLDPELTRKQILLHAEHQFEEGDVLHWWHPPTDRGIRSLITDDLLWLPYTTAFYINSTGDNTILDEQITFLKARQLYEGEHEAYLQPEVSQQRASLYEHCCRAIDRSLTKGAHGLPLIGGGDWNDGMNKVGVDGKGESIWLGFFLYTILDDFIPIVKKFDDRDRLDQYRTHKKELKKHLNKEGWDGEWYRRAYYDDGTPLGSSQNDECRIDAIAQAWSVISGAGTPSKTEKALLAAERHLVSMQDGIIRLLTPAFDHTEKNPGYIKGYIPGVRENGGQYTHAALWLVKAFAEAGETEKAISYMKMLLPVNHAINNKDVERYHVEPYAVAADIYGEDPLVGMGGWTWYTGSAGWMYRVVLESILGITIVDGNKLHVRPTVISSWKKYECWIRNKGRDIVLHIEVLNPNKLSKGTITASLNGSSIAVNNDVVISSIPDSKGDHLLRIVIEE